MATRAVQCVASAARARARTAVTRHAAPACVALSDACGSTPVHGATACGSAGMRVGQWSQARCLATLTPTVGREAEIRPFEVTMGDVDASDGEWEVGAMSDVEGDEAEEVNPLDVLGAPQLVNAHDTPEEAAADLLLFRDHITSTPRVKLPPSLVSQVRAGCWCRQCTTPRVLTAFVRGLCVSVTPQVPDDNEELLDIAHLLDQNASLTYQARVSAVFVCLRVAWLAFLLQRLLSGGAKDVLLTA